MGQVWVKFGRERVVCASGRVVRLEGGDKTVGCPDLGGRHHRRDARPDHAGKDAVPLHRARGESSEGKAHRAKLIGQSS